MENEISNIGGKLVSKSDHETLVIEAWGRDGLRVRATPLPEVLDRPWALTEPVDAAATIEISDTEATITWSPNFGFALAARRVHDRELEGVRLDSVRGLWNAAERIHHGTMVEFAERYAPFGLRRGAVKTRGTPAVMHEKKLLTSPMSW